MNDKCFEIGIIQAFLDGEAAPELSFTLTEHAAKCQACALLLAEAEEENAVVFGALDRELNALVPTQRLWNSISAALEGENSRVSFWDKVRAIILPVFANPSFAAAGSILVVVGLFAFFWSAAPSDTLVAGSLPTMPPVVSTSVGNGSAVGSSSAEISNAVPGKVVEVGETNHSPTELNRLIVNAKHNPGRDRARPQYLVEQELPGEASYVRTIAALKESVDGRKDMVLDPSARIAYERDIAVVNDAIKRMKEIVRKDPKNQAARQVLYSSYQNKIDLLNSVVEREELMAALQ
ncbi:MAG TPA: hypothetical protein PKD26_03680 [Pyrinomonadaceae bacterium]|nr:hypothetical protein [Pyrinomonadaceae bacterium]